MVIDHGFEEHLVERGSVGGLEVGQSLVGEHPGHVTRATGATAHPAHVLGYGLAPLLRWSRVAGIRRLVLYTGPVSIAALAILAVTGDTGREQTVQAAA